MSNNIPVLMLRGEDGKFFPVDGITGGGGTGSASTAANVSYTNTQLPDVKNVKTALDELVSKSHDHDNKDILDKLSDANGKLQYNGSDVSVTKANVVAALGYTPEAVSKEVYTGSNITLADNTEYRLTDVTTLTLTYPTGKFECWMRLTFAASGNITVTLPADTEYLGATPNFKNGEMWELSFKDKVLAAKKVGGDDKDAGGENGVTPHIGENGNWYIGNTDTGKPSRGENGVTPHIGDNGNWYIGSTDTGKPSRGVAGVRGDKGDTGADGKSAYQYAQESGYTGTETEFAEKMAEEQLTGTTADLTPTQVYEAVSAGIPVKVQYTNSTYGLLSFTAFNIAESLSMIVSQTIVYYNGVYILCELYGDKSSNAWGFNSTTLAQKTDIPTVLHNPNALTFTGAVTGSYDGSAAMTVNIPSAVTDAHINSLIDTKLGVIENGSY